MTTLIRCQKRTERLSGPKPPQLVRSGDGSVSRAMSAVISDYLVINRQGESTCRSTMIISGMVTRSLKVLYIAKCKGLAFNATFGLSTRLEQVSRMAGTGVKKHIP